jgi:hypothetical protein
MTFDDLISQLGPEGVAEVLGVSVRTLDNLRRGYVALTVDDFFELGRAFPDHDLDATVQSVGERRFLRGINRKTRNQTSQRGASLRGRRTDMAYVTEQFFPSPPGWVQLSKAKDGAVWTDPVIGILAKSDGTVHPIIAEANGEGTDLQSFALGGGPESRGVCTAAQAIAILANATKP